MYIFFAKNSFRYNLTQLILNIKNVINMQLFNLRNHVYIIKTLLDNI